MSDEPNDEKKTIVEALKTAAVLNRARLLLGPKRSLGDIPHLQPTLPRSDNQKPHMPWWQKVMVIAAIVTILLGTVGFLDFFFGIPTFDALIKLLPS